MTDSPAMEIWSAIAQAKQRGIPAVVITTVATKGSVPADQGSKLLATSEGLITGTVGGGKIEAHVLRVAADLLEQGETIRQESYNLQRDIGMTCGGEMTMLYEAITGGQSWPIALFGAGHVAQALVPLLTTLHCQLTVFDIREDWLARLPSSPCLKKVLVEAFEDGVPHLTSHSHVLSITKGHSSDRPVLREIGKNLPHLPFIGVIGSAAKKAVLWRELREDGLDDQFLNSIECPLGLPIGSNDPAEIAISIAARLIQVRDEPLPLAKK